MTPQPVDARVQRTRDLLRDALITLMRDKPYSAITVQDVLDFAGVSRSTFYTHYRDIDDLFLSDVEYFFEDVSVLLSRAGDVSRRVVPVREFFTHVAEMHDFYEALVASGKIHDVWAIGRGCLARSIDTRLAEISVTHAAPSRTRMALAQALAGAVFSLLDWWMDHRAYLSAAEMDNLYHNLVWAGVSVPSPVGRE